MTYLITGATGNIGGLVADGLIARGIRPRVYVRDATKARARFGDRVELALGELQDDSALARALEGVHALFLVNTGPELAQRDGSAGKLAARAGVKRVVKLSALGARASGRNTAVAEWHAQGESALRASGVPSTFVQPVGFMSNALAWARTIKAEGVVRASTGGGRIAMIDPEDIAAVSIAALTEPDFEGQALAITGPELLTYAEMTAVISGAIEKPLRFESITDDEARASLASHGLPPALADALITLWGEVREGLVAVVSGEVERVLGRKPRSFAHWVGENAQAFR